MKIRKKIISALTPISLLTMINSTASADVFVMKDGTFINGSIISETNDSYKLRAEVSNNAYAEKIILKSKVFEIKKTDPSIAAFKKLTSILPTPDLMDVKDYDKLVKSKIEPFVKDYPESPHIEDAKDILDTLKKEYYTIKNGGLKLNGRLLTPEQIKANKYDIQASIGLHNFMQFVRNKHYRPALSTLERLENDYPDSGQCRKAQRIALKILPIYEVKLQKLYNDVDTLTAKRDRALEGLTPTDRSRTKKIFDREEQQYQNLLNQVEATKKKTKWLPINRYFKDPIEHNLKMVKTELKRLNTASQKPTMNMAKFYYATYTALERGEYKTAKENYDKFKKGKPPVELITNLEAKLAEVKAVNERMARQAKEDEAKAKKEAAEERKKAEQAKRDAKNSKNGIIEEAQDKARKKLNLNKKQEQIDKASQ